MRFVNDGSSKKPRVEIHLAMWSLWDMGDGDREWTLEEKLGKIKTAGFSGIFDLLPQEGKVDEMRELLFKHNLKLGLQTFSNTRDQLKETLDNAERLGAYYVNAQVADGFTVDEDAVKLLRELTEESRSSCIPFFLETHRGRITQDLIRTVHYTSSVPDLWLTLDLSHYIVAGEIVAPCDKVNEHFHHLMQRSACIHGRISNGEQVQVNIRSGTDDLLVNSFIEWWKETIRCWLKVAKPGDIFPLVCEFGPPGYAITAYNETSERWEEVGNRWEQSIRLKELFEICIKDLEHENVL